MNTFISRALWGTLIAGGVTLLGATTAHAAETTGEDGLLSGTQALVEVALPITVSGSSISLLGDASSETAAAPAPVDPAPAAPGVTTSGADAAASGTQGIVSVDVPITVSGNAVSVVGDSASDSAAPAADPAPAAPAASSTTGADGVLSGTQGIVPVDVPITLTGNAVSVLGDSSSAGAPTRVPDASAPASGPGATTDGEDGVLSGTQVIAPVTAPVRVTGNAISVLGDSSSEGGAAPAAPAAPVTGSRATTDGDDGILAGTQVIAPIAAPVTVTGNAISAIGDSSSEGARVPATAGGTAEPTTSGEDSLAGGTQLAAPVAMPITLGGNAISVVGDSTASTPTTPVDPGTPVNPATPGNPGTSGDPGDPGTTGTSGAGANVFTAGSGSAALAATGGENHALLLIAALALCAAGTLALSVRRATA